MFEDIMLNTQAQKKYQVFKIIFVHKAKTNSIRELSGYSELTYNQFYKTLLEINADLNSTNQEAHLTTTKIDQFNCSIDQYRAQLLKDSIPYQFLIALLLQTDKNLDTFLKRNYISASTLSRSCATLKYYLQKFAITINYKQMTLEGDELKIRLCYFYLFYLGSKNQSWHYEVSKSEARQFMHPFRSDNYHKSKTIIEMYTIHLGAVILTRLRQGHFVSSSPKLDFLKASDTSYKTLLSNTSFEISESQAENESANLLFLTHFYPYYDLEAQVLPKKLEVFLLNDEQQLNSITEGLLDYIASFFIEPLSINNRQTLKTNIFLILFGFYLFDSPFPTLPTLMLKPKDKSELAIQIEAQVKSFLKTHLNNFNFPVSGSSLNTLTKTIRQIIISLKYVEINEYKLNVGVIIEPNLLLSFDLLTYLDSLRFVQPENYDDSKKYDFIITTIAISSDTPTYFWDHELGIYQIPSLIYDMKQAYIQNHLLLNKPQKND